jgi:hypothetical protein
VTLNLTVIDLLMLYRLMVRFLKGRPKRKQKTMKDYGVSIRILERKIQSPDVAKELIAPEEMQYHDN